jgi:hypothetical protein
MLNRKRWISPTTDVMYEQYARSARVTPQTLDLGHGAKGHWIGNKDAQNVLIWYHGRIPNLEKRIFLGRG